MPLPIADLAARRTTLSPASFWPAPSSVPDLQETSATPEPKALAHRQYRHAAAQSVAGTPADRVRADAPGSRAWQSQMELCAKKARLPGDPDVHAAGRAPQTLSSAVPQRANVAFLPPPMPPHPPASPL